MKKIIITLLFFSINQWLFAQHYFLRDDKPAKDWMTQAYPIGNGRIGAMIFGGVHTEQIQFNENSLWTGDENETGEYQAFGDVFIDFENKQTTYKNYERKLILDSAVHQISYRQGNDLFQRSYFASYPEQALIFRYTSNGANNLSAKIGLKDAHGQPILANSEDLLFGGKLSNGMQYEARLRVLVEGGTKSIDIDKLGNRIIVIKNATNLTVVLSAATDFANTRSSNWKSTLSPSQKNNEIIKNVTSIPYALLLTRHVKEYKDIYDKMEIRLGNEKFSKSHTTEELLKNYKVENSQLVEALLFQYGRYLLISSSRDGGLPANLQGLWNNSNSPPWRSDYHSNINLQMNYWPTEVANLSTCFKPYLDFIHSIRDVKKQHTQQEYPGVRGWTVRTENNIFGGESFHWNTPGSAWFAQALWEHYAFNLDTKYLREQAYPVLKEICEFWDDRLIRRPNGVVVAPKGWSPEHGPVEDGVSYDHQIIYDLFTNYIETEQILKIDDKYQAHIRDLKDKLLKPKIGRWGQLQEWETDRDDSLNKHRHVSHLFALFPGRQISILETPEFAQAAKVTLTARGDESTGWSMAWKMAFWARLQDGEHAYKILKNFITLVGGENIDYDHGGGVYANMLCAHPPFQIDGNLGYVASLSEMLVQSQTKTLEILPAIPSSWKSGTVKGLKARGNILINELSWDNGKLSSLKLSSPKAQTIQILLPTMMCSLKKTKIINNKYLYSIQLKPNQILNIYK